MPNRSRGPGHVQHGRDAADPGLARFVLFNRAALLVRSGGVSRLRLANNAATRHTYTRIESALARALLNHPELLLADEPTGNLDQDNARIVLGHLAEFTNEALTRWVSEK